MISRLTAEEAKQHFRRFVAVVTLLACQLLPIDARSQNSASSQKPPAEQLGEKLFFDKRLSANGSISCASCHVPSRAFSDGKPVAIGINGLAGVRNTPSLTTAALHDTFFWDGRRKTLESQVTEPLINPKEHGLASTAQAVDIVRSDPEYLKFFGDRGVAIGDLTVALASYVRSLAFSPSRFDQYLSGDARALSDEERRGFELFRGAAQCSSCHTVDGPRPTFTDNKFHSPGLSQGAWSATLGKAAMRAARASDTELEALITTDPSIAALGRFNVTRQPIDIGKYRTPSLRDVAVTAPYMHDGSVATLEEVVEQEIYYRSVQQGRLLILTAREKASLVSFLRALTSQSFDQKEGSQ